MLMGRLEISEGEDSDCLPALLPGLFAKNYKKSKGEVKNTVQCSEYFGQVYYTASVENDYKSRKVVPAASTKNPTSSKI
jgi:hypothetical protein